MERTLVTMFVSVRLILTLATAPQVHIGSASQPPENNKEFFVVCKSSVDDVLYIALLITENVQKNLQ